MNIKDSSLNLFKGFLRGGGILERDKMSVRGKAIHDNHNRGVFIEFVEGTGEVYGQ